MPSSPKRLRAPGRTVHGSSPERAAGHQDGTANVPSQFSQLPDAALRRVCALASTPSCPAFCLLSRVSKEWAAVALKLGIEVQLQLGQFKPSSLVAAALAAAPKVNLLQLPQPAATAVLMKQPMADLATYIQADCIRLVHLKGWMKKYSNQVDTLKISSHSRYAKGMDYWQRQLLASGLASVVQGLAAGRAAQGRLRLTTLDLEVLSFTQLQDTMDTLSACKRLRRLQLTGPSILHTSTSSAIKPSWQAPAGRMTVLPAGGTASANASTGSASSSILSLGLSLSSMSALTYLQLCTDWLVDERHYSGITDHGDSPDLDQLLLRLPPSLQVLKLKGSIGVALSLTSLKRLAQLQCLQLPCHLELKDAPEDPAATAHLTGLECLTSMTTQACLYSSGACLLSPPRLRHLGTGICGKRRCRACAREEVQLKQLAPIRGLQSLSLVGCKLGAATTEVASSLQLLTQLQHLTLLSPLEAAWQHADDWCAALGHLVSLQSLHVAGQVLLVPEVGARTMRALTALTRLAVSCQGVSPKSPPPHGGGAEVVHPLGAVGRVLGVVQRAAGSVKEVELSWVDTPVPDVMAAAAEQLPARC